MLKHVGAGDPEVVGWVKIVDEVMVREGQPGLLEEDDLRLTVCQKFTEIKSISL